MFFLIIFAYTPVALITIIDQEKTVAIHEQVTIVHIYRWQSELPLKRDAQPYLSWV